MLGELFVACLTLEVIATTPQPPLVALCLHVISLTARVRCGKQRIRLKFDSLVQFA